MNLDDSLNNFNSFISNYEVLKNIDISESDTRSKVIDKLFIEVLGWEEKDISREGHVDSGYYDYKISIPGFHVIVEAKKHFIKFTLPINKRKTSFNSLFKENKEIITQIRSYMTDSGISNGIITNGNQLIIGRFVNIDGTDWKKNQCLIFNGFEDVKERFIEFHNNCSRESIIENGGFDFYSEDLAQPAYKIVSTLVEREKEIIRNNLSAEIAPLINHVFGEISQEDELDNAEFFRECFITNEEIKKNRNEIERLFGDEAPNLSEVIPAKNTDSVATQIESEIYKTPIEAKEIHPPKPIIIVGSKGSGKTTFINYLFKNKISENTLNKHPYIYLDFRQYFNQDKFIDIEKIAQDILEYLYENYSQLNLHSTKILKRIYFKEIKRNDESIWDDLKDKCKEEYDRKLRLFFENKQNEFLEHLQMLSKYLIRERRIRLLLIFDNADQFDSKLQERVFLIANTLNRNANCGVIVSLREGYYYKWRNSPPFDAFESNVYHISAPRYNEVLQKRINYTLSKIEMDGKTCGVSSKGLKIQIDNHSIYEFLFGLKESLFSDDNNEMIDFLNYSSFPNIREGLRLFKQFLVSGYTDVSEYIMRVRFSQNQEKHVYIPIHEFFKTMGLNNKLYYNHETSVIPNLFYPVEGSNDHFIKIWILKYLQKQLDTGGNATKYIQLTQLLIFFTNIGYKLPIINKEIIELLKRELIETDDILSDIEWEVLTAKDFNICLSAKGNYYLKNAKNRFHYYDLILQDTPIFSKTHFEKIKKVFPLANDKGIRNLSDRLLSVKEFVNYLKEMEKTQHKELIKIFNSIVDEILSFGLDKDFKNIEEKINPPV